MLLLPEPNSPFLRTDMIDHLFLRFNQVGLGASINLVAFDFVSVYAWAKMQTWKQLYSGQKVTGD